MGTSFYTIPQIVAGPSITPRNIFTSEATATFKNVPSFYMIDGALSRDSGQSYTSGNSTGLLRTGLIMGKITATGKYRPAIIGVLSTAAANTDTTLVVTYGTAVEMARLVAANGSTAIKLGGPPTAAGTFASTGGTVTSVAVGTTTGTLTLSGSLTVAKAAGSLVQPADGSQVPVTVLCDNPYGVEVTDVNGTSINQFMQRFLLGGDLIAANIINLLADESATPITIDTSVTAYLKAQLQTNGKSFTFNDDR